MPLCECGCGVEVTRRFVRGHQKRNLNPDYIVNEDTGCWEWQKNRSTAGYGYVWKGKVGTPAHRAYYERHRGPIPAGLYIDHLCRNRACVNPDHLEPVTNAENNRRGAKTKLTWTQVHAIRADHRGPTAVARDFGIAPSTVQGIRSGKRWVAA